MDVLETIRTRRTVRFFKPDLLTDEQIVTIVDAGRLAPTGGNQQPWEFIIIRDDKSRERICKLFHEYFFDLYNSKSEDDPWRILVKNKLGIVRNYYNNAPVFIAVLADTTGETHVQDTSAAIENMTLAAWSLGIGTAWLDMLPEKEVRILLDIPDRFKLMACMPFGYPEEIGDRKPRKRIEDIVHYEKYGQKHPSK